MSVTSKVITVVLLVLLAAGCGSEEPQSWVVGQSTELSQRDKLDLASGTQVARRYIEAWGKADYDTMWNLRCRQCVKNRDTFLKLASTWRTKGVQHAFSTLGPADIEGMVASLALLRHLSDEQAQVLLSLGVVAKSAYEKLRKKSWPDRVMVMEFSVKGQKSLFLVVKEDSDWSVVNDPGTLDPKHLLFGASGVSGTD